MTALLLFAAAALGADVSLDSLYESNQWFQLRDAVRADAAAGAFYRGMTELAFHDWARAEADLKEAAAGTPASVTVETMDQASRAALAMDALSDFYFTVGRYRDAAEQLDRFARYAPSLGLSGRIARDATRSLNSYRALYAATAKSADQSVTARGDSKLPFSMVNSSPVIEAAVDGKSSRMMLDTGSSANFMNPSEAKRLGLTVHSAPAPLDAYDGAKEKTGGIAIVNELAIGAFRLRNAAFFILSEDDDDVPALLGLPALYALGTVRWSEEDGMLEVGFDAPPGGEPNLAFDGASLLTEGILTNGARRDSLTFTVDTGTDETLVYPPLARLLDSNFDSDSLANRNASLLAGGFEAPLRDASLTLTSRTGDFEGLDGNLGLDIMQQGSTVSIDLVNMRLTIGSGSVNYTPSAAAPDTAPSTLEPGNLSAAELHEIMKASIDEDNLDFEPSRDYVYTENRETRMLDAKGNVTDSHTETHESIDLYGERFDRVVARDGKPLTTKQQKAEQDKIDREGNRRKQESLAARTTRLERERACAAEFLDAYTYTLVGAENLSGRPAWVIDAEPDPNASAKCIQKQIRQFRLRLWIDQADRKWAKVEADNVAPVTWGGILVRAPAGAAHLTMELTRREDGAWLPSNGRVRFDLKLILLKTVRIEVLWTYSDYRKFQSNSRVVEAKPE